jgi:hypothetical protein
MIHLILEIISLINIQRYKHALGSIISVSNSLTARFVCFVIFPVAISCIYGRILQSKAPIFRPGLQKINCNEMRKSYFITCLHNVR